MNMKVWSLENPSVVQPACQLCGNTFVQCSALGTITSELFWLYMQFTVSLRVIGWDKHLTQMSPLGGIEPGSFWYEGSYPDSYPLSQCDRVKVLGQDRTDTLQVIWHPSSSQLWSLCIEVGGHWFPLVLEVGTSLVFGEPISGSACLPTMWQHFCPALSLRVQVPVPVPEPGQDQAPVPVPLPDQIEVPVPVLV